MQIDEDLRYEIRYRARLIHTAARVGVIVGLVGTGVAYSVVGNLPRATEVVFSLTALAFGIGLVGWSGSIMAGRGFENLQRHLSTGSEWTEADSRRAMTRIGGFGAGGMLGTALVTAALL